MSHNSMPRILSKSIRYPTYQLYAVATNTKETAENQLIIGALSVLEWVRTKFREFEIPDAFRAPPPESYLNVSIFDLKSAHIDCGYAVETVCIPEDKIWAFRLIEPDLSTQLKEGVEVSTAIPGRVFETNIAFRVVGSRMQMGVELIVSEPENIRDSNQAVVLRPAVVSTLAKNSKIGLFSGYLIKNHLWELNSKERIKQLRENLKRWMIPAVVFCDYADKKIANKQNISKFPVQVDFSEMLKQSFVSTGIVLPQQITSDVAVNDLQAYIPYDTDRFINARLAYVHCFHLPYDQFETFSRSYQTDVQSGDVFFLGPDEFGAGIMRFEYTAATRDSNFRELMTLSRDYLRKKPLNLVTLFS